MGLNRNALTHELRNAGEKARPACRTNREARARYAIASRGFAVEHLLANVRHSVGGY